MDEIPELGDAFGQLDDMMGQSYYRLEFLAPLVMAFAPEVEPEYYEDIHNIPDSIEAAEWALSKTLRDTAYDGDDALGMVAVWPHERVLTAEDASAIIVAALGEEPDDSTMLGHGSTADVRHEANIDTIREAIGDPEPAEQ